MAKVYARWKEELVWESGREKLVFDFSMGIAHVYFPSIEKWQRTHPSLTRERYGPVLADVRAWTRHEGVPLTVEERADVRIERA